MEGQVVLFWYGILNKKIVCWVWDLILLQITQLTLVMCFNYQNEHDGIYFSECVSIIKMSMVEEWVVTLRFN
jgi:hypothetical protein